MITYENKVDKNYYSAEAINVLLKEHVKSPLRIYRAIIPTNLPIVRFYYFDEFTAFLTASGADVLLYDYQLFEKSHYHVSPDRNILHVEDIASYNKEMEQILSNYPMSTYSAAIVKDNTVYIYTVPTVLSDYIKTPVFTAKEFLDSLR